MCLHRRVLFRSKRPEDEPGKAYSRQRDACRSGQRAPAPPEQKRQHDNSGEVLQRKAEASEKSLQASALRICDHQQEDQKRAELALSERLPDGAAERPHTGDRTERNASSAHATPEQAPGADEEEMRKDKPDPADRKSDV